ncbi:TPA: hypothetical protein TXL63_001149 [Streptococcus suis]|nr:hypothetical protein [Streptococcus suis]
MLTRTLRRGDGLSAQPLEGEKIRTVGSDNRPNNHNKVRIATLQDAQGITSVTVDGVDK